MLDYSSTKKLNHKTKSARKPLFRYIIYLGFVLGLLTLFIQLYVMSLFATKGYEIKQLEEKKAELVVNNKELEKSISLSRSLDYLRSKIDSKEFTSIDPKELQYLTIEK